MSPAPGGSGEAVVSLILPGAPRTKKTSQRIWMVGKRKVVKPSDQWMAWRDAVRAHAFRMRWGRPKLDAPVNCCALFFRDARRGDACGYYQGLADVLQELEIVSDDKFITQWDGSRLLVDRECPRVVVTLTPLPRAG